MRDPFMTEAHDATDNSSERSERIRDHIRKFVRKSIDKQGPKHEFIVGEIKDIYRVVYRSFPVIGPLRRLRPGTRRARIGSGRVYPWRTSPELVQQGPRDPSTGTGEGAGPLPGPGGGHGAQRGDRRDAVGRDDVVSGSGGDRVQSGSPCHDRQAGRSEATPLSCPAMIAVTWGTSSPAPPVVSCTRLPRRSPGRGMPHRRDQISLPVPSSSMTTASDCENSSQARSAAAATAVSSVTAPSSS